MSLFLKEKGSKKNLDRFGSVAFPKPVLDHDSALYILSGKGEPLSGPDRPERGSPFPVIQFWPGSFLRVKHTPDTLGPALAATAAPI